jgi:hypothetical protein
MLLSSLFCLCACSNAVPEPSLVGDYVASYGDETATLSLKADHTYAHSVSASGHQVAQQVSTWKASQMSTAGRNSTVVDFSGFLAIPSFKEKQNVKVGWATEVDQTWLGRTRLCFDSDVGYCYVKQGR